MSPKIKVFDMETFNPVEMQARLRTESPRAWELMDMALRSLVDERYPETLKGAIVAACVWGAFVIGKQVERGEPG